MPPPLRPAYYELAMVGLLAEMTGVELVGATVELDLHELGAVGPALVVDVRPCPEIPARPGQVITATFKHASANVVDLVLSDYPVSSPGTPDNVAFRSSPSALRLSTSVGNPSTPEMIGVTGNHPFWSLDRLEFVQVGELAIGERLQTLSGDTKWVQQKLPRPGPEPVYNLEIHGEHVYYVSDSGVLAHNSYLDKVLVDNDVMVMAFKGNSNAISALSVSARKYITPNQLREFLNVTTQAEKKARRAFLAQQGIKVLNPKAASHLAGTSIFKDTFGVISKTHGRGDAALVSFARAGNFKILTGEKRLPNFVTNTLGIDIRHLVHRVYW